MPLYNGQKFACDSCIRGHRVSTCQHDDRPLKLIPPKGRPVKQCDHCRTARKSKSHHGKCDCGSKKEKKDKDKVEVKNDYGCCCHKGDSCVCSTRAESIEVRMERSLKRPTQPVKSKPMLSTSQSETKLTQFANGHHKPCHRNNNLAHTSGKPYKVPRPHTLHGISAFARTEQDREYLENIPRASDDLWLGQTSSTSGEISPPSFSRTNSQDSIELGGGGCCGSSTTSVSMSNEPFSFDFDNHFGRQSSFKLSPNHLSTVAEDSPNLNFLELASTSVSNANFHGLTLNTSPNFVQDYDTLFSPSDLPLVSPHVSLTQTISHSGDSTYQSYPGLSNSTGSHESENEAFAEAFYNEPPALSLESAVDTDLYLDMGLPIKTPQARHMSSSSAITAINLGTSVESEGSAIVIPRADEAGEQDDWAWTDLGLLQTGQGQQESSSQIRDLNWLF